MINNELTPRERDVCDLAVSGLSNPEIASILSNSENAVKNNLKKVYKKYVVSGRVELAKITRDTANYYYKNSDGNTFAGLWVSKFTYTRSNGNLGWQFDVEHIWKSSKGYLGQNVIAFDGGREYFHKLSFEVSDRMLRGKWENTNTHNVGVFQLSVSSSKNSMEGKHLGNDNQLKIQSGEWFWVRIEVDEQSINNIVNINDSQEKKQIRNQIEKYFDECLGDDKALKLSLTKCS